MAKKAKTRAEREHMNTVAMLGCVACRNMGYGASPAELHHVRTGIGMGQRSAHTQVLPLCPLHHRAPYPTGFHTDSKAWQKEHGTEVELLAQIESEIKELIASIV